MARISKGFADAMSGRVGNVIVSSWKGIQYIKAHHKPRTEKISAKEKANRQKFRAAHQWLAPLLEFVRRGYHGYSPTVEGFLAAKSYLLKNAMDADGTVNSSLMKVSSGHLPLSENIAASMRSDGKLEFTWNPRSVSGGSNRDQVMLLAYSPEKSIAMYTINGEFRESGSAILEPQMGGGDLAHVYVAFVAEDRSTQSDSIYLGQIAFT